MTGKIVIWLLLTVLLTTTPPAEAQKEAKVYRIGILDPTSSAASALRIKAFRQGLRELGYIEGKNVIIESRFAEGKLEPLPDLASELVRLKVDVLVTNAFRPVQAAQKASNTIPIVFAAAADPVGSGLVSSLASPGGNVTGLSLFAPELNGKRLELLKEAFPKVRRVGFLTSLQSTSREQRFKELEAVAKATGVTLQSVAVKDADDFEKAFGAAKNAGAQALIATPSPFLNNHRERIVNLAAKNRLPAMYTSNEFTEAGGLMSYGPDILDNWRRAATYVDKIFKGRKPADLPVEQPMKFEFVISLKAAKQIGVTIPPNVLVRADKVIK